MKSLTYTAEFSRCENGQWSSITETRTVKVGDAVGFKYDVEQGGEVLDINVQERRVKALAFEGDYVDSVNGTELWIDVSDLF